ncbi:hypothetical protein [Pseudacidovorax intermedius]|uniref:hypothetical protein n=1 Tax=Pseudacidovorax intermedius TaxID=433924 RepID=UPI00128FC6EF|nr:hypothetical protein [Pseudacidovorax intermedius]
MRAGARIDALPGGPLPWLPLLSVAPVRRRPVAPVRAPSPAASDASDAPDAAACADLRAVLAALTLHAPEASGVHIDWQMPDAALWVPMGPAALAACLHRLLAAGAAALGPTRGLLRVHARAEGATAAVSVLDVPAGGPPGALARQLQSLSQSAGPFGDGALQALAECAAAVQARRGRLYAAPCFGGAMGATLRLPRAAAPALGAPTDVREAP